MKEGIYWVTLFIHVTIYASLSFFVCPDALPEETEFEHTQLRQDIKKLIGNDASSKLSASDKLKLACTYFWLGYLQNTIAILDAKNRDKFTGDIDNLRDLLGSEHLLTKGELEDWDKNSRKERSQVFLYLGYSYLSLGDESKAYKNFIDAFRFNPELEWNNNALRYDYLEGIITDAKIAAQMRVALDLFVAVDISKSVSRSEVKNIEELQLDVCNKLRPTDHVLFFPFADMSSRPPFPDSSPSPNSIVKDLRTADSTDFAKLFEKLVISMPSHEGTITDPTRQTAILIISDGEHSVSGNEGGGEARIPSQVSKKLANFLCTHSDIPIVIITVDRTGKKGSDYATKWTEEFDTYSGNNKKSFHYNSGSKEENLKNIFETIAPDRSKTFVIRDPKAENQSSLFNDRNHTLKLLIQSPLQGARVEVTGKPNWSVESHLFNSRWKKEEYPAKFTTINQGESRKSVDITCVNVNEAIPAFQRLKPLIFTLTFHLHPEQGRGQEKREVGKINLLFQKDKPTLQITNRFDHKLILVSSKRRCLKFRANIKPSYPLLGQLQLIPLQVKISKNPCFTTTGGTVNPSTAIIFLETGGQTGRHEFNLPIVAVAVDGFFGKESNNDVKINFPTNNNSTEHYINNQVKKTDFRVVPLWLYILYRINMWAWILFVLILGYIVLYFIVYPFWDGRVFTIAHISGKGFKVSGNTIYDSKGKQVLRLRQKWWSGTFEFAEIGFKSGIETAKLFWQRSGKEKVDKMEEINPLSQKHRMKPRRTYTIILSEDGNRESKFNVVRNYRLQTWHKVVKWVWIPIGICAAILGSASIYVSWPLSALEISILIFSAICIVGYVYYKWRKNRDSNDSHWIDDFAGLGRGVSLADASIRLIEIFIQFIFPM